MIIETQEERWRDMTADLLGQSLERLGYKPIASSRSWTDQRTTVVMCGDGLVNVFAKDDETRPFFKLVKPAEAVRLIGQARQMFAPLNDWDG